MGIHEGHRRRVKDRIANHGLDNLADHEVLEALLFYPIPYRDTNPIAHDLLSQCGALNHLLYMPKRDLSLVKGCGERCADFLMLFSEAGRRAFIASGNGTRITDMQAMTALAARTAEGGADECSFLLLFDNRMTLVDSRVLFEGYFASSAVRPSLIAEPALKLHASSAVIVTRHANRVACPDLYERETMRYLQTSLEQIGIHLLECYIVGGNLAIPMFQNHKTSFPLCIASPATPLRQDDAVSHEVLPAPVPYAEEFSDEEILLSLFEHLMPLDHGKTAAALVEKYGSITTLLSVEDGELLSQGVTAHALSFLRLLLPAYGRCMRAGYPPRHAFTTADDRGTFFTTCFAGTDVESVYMLLMNREKQSITLRCMAVGSTNSANLNTRALVEAALFSGAACVSLAHNHPQGNTTPSEADKQTTDALSSAFRTIGVTLTDHFIIAGNLYASIPIHREDESN